MIKIAERTIIVIFGALGDLTQRKLVPALVSLYSRGRLPGSTARSGRRPVPSAVPFGYPANFFPATVERLGKEGMASEEEAWRRIVIEKPSGRDLA